MSWVEDLREAIRGDEPGVKARLTWDARQLTLTISMLAVPEDRRGQGVARRVVGAVVEAADLAGARVAATPSDEFGADRERLRRFLEGFGFVRNTGEHRDWACTQDYVRPHGGEGQA